MHPRYEVKKVYSVKISGRPSAEDLDRLRKGIKLEDGWTAPAQVRVVETLSKKAWLEMEIHEGRYREVRRMFQALGFFVEKLIRTRMGPLRLGPLAPGEYRSLLPQEIAALKKTVGLPTGRVSAPARR